MPRNTTGYVFQRIVNGKKQKHYSAHYQINGKRFLVVLVDSSGNRITSERDALAALEKLLLPIRIKKLYRDNKNVENALITTREQLSREAKKTQIKLANAWNAFIERNECMLNCNPIQKRFYILVIERFVNFCGDKIEFIDEVTTDVAKQYYARIMKDYATKTVKENLAFLKRFFNAFNLKENPFDKITPPRKTDDVKKRNLSIDELKKVLKVVSGNMKTLFYIGMSTGLRLNDARLVAWEEIDMQKRIIKKRTHKTGQNVIIGIPETLYKIFDSTPLNKRNGYVLKDFSSMNVNTLSIRIQKCFRDAGIETQQKTKNRNACVVGFHSLRHTFATMCGETGAPQSVTQQILGHSKVAMTQYYQHETIQGVTDVAQKLDSIFEGI